jgi:hypothetical protein
MGTRNLTRVIDNNGEVRVAQYGQWDGYPSGQGINALLHSYFYQEIERGLEKVRWATDAEVEEIYANFPKSGLFGTEDSHKFGLFYPNLTRDTCANILGVIAWSVGEVVLVNNSDFENDTLMCEGIYTIDLQKQKFISWYDGHTVEFDLKELPTQKAYLEAWAKVMA